MAIAMIEVKLIVQFLVKSIEQEISQGECFPLKASLSILLNQIKLVRAYDRWHTND